MNGPQSFYARYGKRALDFFIAAVILLAFCWLYAILAILVRVKLGSPVIFHQRRLGRGERSFRLCKFRSMTDERDENGELLPDAVRLTPFGRWFRSTSLDELPELWNILKGDMSFVGPRPLLEEYLPYYKPEERRRHEVRPGLTGLAQISGRNYLTWEQVFAYDVQYVESVSFAADCRILFGTVGKVLRREDIGESGETVTDQETGEQKPRIHYPLHIERGQNNAEGNRK